MYTVNKTLWLLLYYGGFVGIAPRIKVIICSYNCMPDVVRSRVLEHRKIRKKICCNNCVITNYIQRCTFIDRNHKDRQRKGWYVLRAADNFEIQIRRWIYCRLRSILQIRSSSEHQWLSGVHNVAAASWWELIPCSSAGPRRFLSVEKCPQVQAMDEAFTILGCYVA